jgi:hypothetical protein
MATQGQGRTTAGEEDTCGAGVVVTLPPGIAVCTASVEGLTCPELGAVMPAAGVEVVCVLPPAAGGLTWNRLRVRLTANTIRMLRGAAGRLFLVL